MTIEWYSNNNDDHVRIAREVVEIARRGFDDAAYRAAVDEYIKAIDLILPIPVVTTPE